MDYRRHSAVALTTAVLIGIAAQASAGELGPTSYGSISIGINIPPRFQLDPARASAGRESIIAGHAFCIETNGVHNYHVAVLDPESLTRRRPSIAARSTFQALSTDRADCGLGRAAFEIHSANQISQAIGSPPRPLTLLIIPD